jgi:hypothetical protein
MSDLDTFATATPAAASRWRGRWTMLPLRQASCHHLRLVRGDGAQRLLGRWRQDLAEVRRTAVLGDDDGWRQHCGQHAQNFIWVASGNQPPAYTLDGGKTWSNITIPGVSDWGGMHMPITSAAPPSPRIAFFRTPSTCMTSRPGVYKTSDGGATWTKMTSSSVADWAYWHSRSRRSLAAPVNSTSRPDRRTA